MEQRKSELANRRAFAHQIRSNQRHRGRYIHKAGEPFEVNLEHKESVRLEFFVAAGIERIEEGLDGLLGSGGVDVNSEQIERRGEEKV